MMRKNAIISSAFENYADSIKLNNELVTTAISATQTTFSKKPTYSRFKKVSIIFAANALVVVIAIIAVFQSGIFNAKKNESNMSPEIMDSVPITEILFSEMSKTDVSGIDVSYLTDCDPTLSIYQTAILLNSEYYEYEHDVVMSIFQYRITIDDQNADITVTISTQSGVDILSRYFELSEYNYNGNTFNCTIQKNADKYEAYTTNTNATYNAFIRVTSTDKDIAENIAYSFSQAK